MDVWCGYTAGEIRLLASAKLIDGVNAAWSSRQPVSLSDVLRVLRHQLTVAECDVFAYVSIESDVIVIVTSIIPSPTRLQVLRRPVHLSCS